MSDKDTIYRQDAIDAVKKHYRAHDNDLLELIAFDIERLPFAQPPARCVAEIKIDKGDLEALIARQIEELKESMTNSAKPEQQWIPCSKRMPEEETDVLICNSTGNIAISRGAYSTEASDWIWYTSGWRFGEVVAWMPLPEPYKAERREDG